MTSKDAAYPWVLHWLKVGRRALLSDHRGLYIGHMLAQSPRERDLICRKGVATNSRVEEEEEEDPWRVGLCRERILGSDV